VLFFFCLGWLMVALGFIGVFVPLMPTTIFLIVAAWLFARSSPRLEAWLFGHPNFGPALVAWREHGAVSRSSKIAACVGMTIGFILFWIGSQPRLWPALVVAGMLLGAACYVVSRPTARTGVSESGEKSPCA
jgi:uncharacterized membrane protein YbaN (DUF454 family)